MKSRAVVFIDQHQVAVQTIDVPEPGPRDVVIEVVYSWISNGTESSFLRGERTAGDTPYQEGHRWPFPIVAGYQKTGYILSVGEEVSEFKPGDHVFASISRVEGMHEPFGGHVSPAVTPVDQVWRLPDDADGLDYSGLVLTQVGYNCGQRPHAVRPGDAAIVLGDGMVGHWAAQTLRHRGARVLVAGRHDSRLSRLMDGLGGVNTRQTPLTEAALDFVGSGGLSILVDTAGSMDSVTALLPYMAQDGHLVSAGFYGSRGHIDIQTLRDREVTLYAPAGWNRTRMDETLAGVREGWLQTRPLITHRYPVDQAAEAWQLISTAAEPFLGVVLTWR